MPRFSDVGVDVNSIIGKKVEIEELFNKRILIEKIIITPSKFPGKNSSGMRMQMQVVLASFNDVPDASGDYFKKDENGFAVGERRSCFTGSDMMMKQIHDSEANLEELNKERIEKGEQPIESIFPMDTTIVKAGKCFKFT